MDTFLNPSQVLDQLDLSLNMIAADFGSGSGGWAIPLAKKLKSGKVFAVDILQEPLSALSSSAKMEKVWNIQTICANVENLKDTKFGGLDLVLMTNLLFQSEKKKEILTEAYRCLKVGGQVLVVDWSMESPISPTEGHIAPSDVKKIAINNGFRFVKDLDVAPHHYGLLFIKP